MNRGIVEFSMAYVRAGLNLPDGTTILGIRLDPFHSSTIQLAVEHSALPEVREAEQLPFVRLTDAGRWATSYWDELNADG